MYFELGIYYIRYTLKNILLFRLELLLNNVICRFIILSTLPHDMEMILTLNKTYSFQNSVRKKKKKNYVFCVLVTRLKRVDKNKISSLIHMFLFFIFSII